MFQTLLTSVHDFQSFVQETKILGESFLSSLIASDAPVLHELLGRLESKYSR